jgi:hypothetical protein
MRQGIGAVAMVIVVIDIVKETPYVFAPRIIDGQERLPAATAMGLGLLPHEAEATPIDGVLPPRRLREEAREVGVVGALQDAAGDIGQALIGEDDQAGQIMLEMPKLGSVPVTGTRIIRRGHRASRRKRRGIQRELTWHVTAAG